MEHGEDSTRREPWYAARCIFCDERSGTLKTYEERVILLWAESEEQAIRLAEEEAQEYAAGSPGCSYTGFLDLFHLFDEEIGHRAEVFSLMRSSDLNQNDYLNRYYDTGSEHSRRDSPKQ
jgi:hypothetical protein